MSSQMNTLPASLFAAPDAAAAAAAASSAPEAAVGTTDGGMIVDVSVYMPSAAAMAFPNTSTNAFTPAFGVAPPIRSNAVAGLANRDEQIREGMVAEFHKRQEEIKLVDRLHQEKKNYKRKHESLETELKDAKRDRDHHKIDVSILRSKNAALEKQVNALKEKLALKERVITRARTLLASE